LSIERPSYEARTKFGLALGDFDGLTGMFFLLMRDYRVTLPASVFSDLSSLRELWIVSAELETLDEGVFHGLTGLETLHLSNNHLETLPGGAFNGGGIRRLAPLNRTFRLLFCGKTHGFRRHTVAVIGARRLMHSGRRCWN